MGEQSRELTGPEGVGEGFTEEGASELDLMNELTAERKCHVQR